MTPEFLTGAIPRVLAVADSDSYLKWAAATLDTLPGDWQRELVVINNPVAPSPDQARAAAGPGTAVRHLSWRGLNRHLRHAAPDVLLLGCTGPVVREIVRSPACRTADRPVVVTGLPGVSIPATERACEFRAGCDLFVVHSRRERTEFAALAEELGLPHRFALATLPFLPQRSAGVDVQPGRDVVLAAQAQVPVERADRVAVLAAMVAVPDGLRPVIKLRARPGEEQTHREQWAYPDLIDDLADAERLNWATGSMAAALADAAALVTVSSTAVLEAIAMDLPALVINDFGISAEMINIVFADSGLVGSLDDLRAGDFRTVDPGWKRDNYFHEKAENTLAADLEELLAVRSTLPVPRTVPVGTPWGRFRRGLRLRLPAPVWSVLRTVRPLIRPR